MSLLPLFLNDNWHTSRPSRLLDQHFGVGLDLDDLLSPLTHPSDIRALSRCPTGYYRPWRSTASGNDTGSTVIANKDGFQVKLDVQQFKPEEITVKVTGKNTVTIEGKHEEKQDEHGYISRHFVRKYVLPDGHDINNVVSNLSSDGVLSITAPKIGEENNEHREIRIQQTGQPAKAIKNKTEDQSTQKKH